MFRIKTDIRQYKCETKDKVEKLIRNWVIRPTDLIYHSEQKEWLPIGEHPAFTKLFVVLDEQERNTPDTVVTADSTLRGADESAATAVRTDATDEVTHIVERPEFDEDSDELRTTDVFDQDEVARTLAKKPIPQPPAGVEPLSNDEVTTMTERTLDMLKITDEDAEAAASAADEDEEITDVRKKKSDTQPATNGVSSVEVSADLVAEVAEAEPPPEEPTPAAPPAADPSPPRLGRHDLPEELFATNEISSPQVRERLEKMDDLADLASEPSEPTAAKPARNGGAATGRLQEDSSVDEAWEEIAEELAVPPAEAREELRDTDEIDRDEAETDEKPRNDDLEEDLDEAFEEDELYEDESGEGEDDWDDDTSEPRVSAADFVSEGYRIPLPFRVGPTPDDIRLGLKPSKYSSSRKDRTYPVPEPKKLDELHRRRFNLSPPPPRDQTWAIVMLVVLLIAFIAISVWSC